MSRHARRAGCTWALLCSTALLTLGTPTVARPSDETRKLQIMSFNIKAFPFLPSLFTGGGFERPRFALLGRLLAERSARGEGPDILFLQEAFSDDARDLLDAAKFQHVYRGPEARSPIGVSSGLYILSRHPIVSQAQRGFRPEDCAGWDCFANKGVQLARVAIPGLPR